MLAITNKLAALGGVDCTVDVQRNAFGKEKPQPKKRKAVDASEALVTEVRYVFNSYEGPMRAKQVWQHLPEGAPGVRTVNVACCILRDRGELVGGSGGWRLAQQKENGMDETVPSRTPAE